jgi:hypothetical protein
MLLYNLDAMLLNSEAYKIALIEEGIYSRLPGLVGQQIQYGMTYDPCLESPEQCESESGLGDPESGPPAYFRILSDDDWEYLIATLLEPEWLQATAESALDQVFDNLNSDAPPEQISISLVDLKTKFEGPVGYQALLALLKKQPPCTAEQILQIGAAQLFEGEMDDFLLCNPPEILMDVVEPLMREAIQSAAFAIPDEMTFEHPFSDLSGPIAITEFGDNPIQSFFIARSYLRFAFLIPLAFLFLLTVFAVRSIRDWLLWWGVPFLLTGFMGLILSALSIPILGWVVPRLIGAALPAGVTPELFSIGADLGNALFRQITQKIMIQSGVMAAIGSGFVISAFFVKPSPMEIGDPLPESSVHQE